MPENCLMNQARLAISLLWIVSLAIPLVNCGPKPLQIVADLSAREGVSVIGRPGSGVIYRGEASTEQERSQSLDSEDRHRLIQAASDIRKIARSLPAPDQAKLHGFFRLLVGDRDRAILKLKIATAYSDPQADAFNVLAAAYLTRATQEGQAFDLVLALRAVLRAQERDPDSPDVRFNIARILSAFSLCRQANSAWERFLEVADREPSIAEAEAWIERCQAPNKFILWTEQKTLLEEVILTSDRNWAGEIVRKFPFRARLYVEESLLGTWASAATAGNTEIASRTLAISRAIGKALATQRGEYMVQDAVATIDRLAAVTDTPSKDLLQGHRLFAEGMVSYYAQELATADEKLIKAREHLERVGSPLSKWAEFYGTICLYYNDSAEAIQRFNEQLASIDPERFPSLAGRLHWLLGTAIQNDEPLSLAHYRNASQFLDASSGSAGSSMLHLLIAEVHKLLADPEQAWQHRLLALEQVSASGDPRRIHSMLGETVHALLAQGFGVEAEPFLSEMAFNAKNWAHHPYSVAEVHHLWAQQAIALGQSRRALEEIQATRTVIEQLEESGLTRWLENWLLVYEGQALLEQDPEATRQLISEGFARLDEMGNQVERPRYLADRATASLVLGDVEAAAADLEEAIGFYERTRLAIKPGLERARFFRQVQPAFDQLISLQLTDSRDGTRAAFATSERARARLISDLATKGAKTVNPMDLVNLEEVASKLGRRQVLVEFVFHSDGLTAWVIASEGLLRTVHFDLDQKQLDLEIDLFSLQLQDASEKQIIIDAGSTLFDSIVRPLEIPPNRDHWIIVPDGPLADLPYGALFDTHRQQFLGALKSLSILPTARFLTREESFAQQGHLLLVGNPTGDLVATVEETRSIERLYDDSMMFLGKEATRSAFLEGIESAEMVHFAGHSEANPEQAGRSRLHLSDGSLDATELWLRDLSKIRLVVLSSCRSSRGHNRGRQALFGLAGGFLSAGTKEVVASHWNIDDGWTHEVMVRFHQNYKLSQDAAAAYRQTIAELVQIKKLDSPSVWGAFSVFGTSNRHLHSNFTNQGRPHENKLKTQHHGPVYPNPQTDRP